MLSSSAGWLFGVISITLIWLVLLIRKGPTQALGAAVALSFVFPVWATIDISEVPFTIQTTVLCIAMLGYAIHPQGKIISPLTLLDFCIALMYVTHVLADTFATGLTPSLPLLAYGEWALPYVAGRYAVRNEEDLRFIAPWIAGSLAFLGVVALVESLTVVNPFEVVFGNRPVELGHRAARRFGFKRAFGPTTHAIYFGMMMIVLMPWLVCLWQAAKTRQAKIRTAVAALLGIIGCLSSVSRTPIVTLLIAAAIVTVVRFRALRWPLALTVVAAVVGFLMFPNEVTDTVSRWTGGGERVRLIEVDGKAVETSSSRSRLVLFTAYSKALIQGGLTGYGSKAVSKFPPEIPYMQGKSEATEVKSIDNGYVLLTLRFGWLGGGCFLLMFLTAVFSAVLLHLDRPDRLFAASVGSLLLVIAAFGMFLVWMSYDFGLEILWTFGVLSGLSSSGIQNRRSGSRLYR